MIRVGVVILRVLRSVILRVAILRVREEYLENTLRAGAYAHARERRGSGREKSVARGGKPIKKSTGNAHEMHGGITTEKLLIYY